MTSPVISRVKKAQTFLAIYYGLEPTQETPAQIPLCKTKPSSGNSMVHLQRRPAIWRTLTCLMLLASSESELPSCLLLLQTAIMSLLNSALRVAHSIQRMIRKAFWPTLPAVSNWPRTVGVKTVSTHGDLDSPFFFRPVLAFTFTPCRSAPATRVYSLTSTCFPHEIQSLPQGLAPQIRTGRVLEQAQDVAIKLEATETTSKLVPDERNASKPAFAFWKERVRRNRYGRIYCHAKR